jgi:two-component system, LytTR family, sensor kinase
MPEVLNLREPLLVNAIGHSAGMLIFGFLLLVLLQDKRLRNARRGLLPPFAALLAVLWNAGALFALAGSTSGGWSAVFPAAVGFSALSLLPAAMLAISLDVQAVGAQRTGWLLSALAVAMHIAEAITGESGFHRTGLLIVTIGFVVLPAIAGFKLHAQRGALTRVLMPMALVLFAVSFVHFADSHAEHPWTAELAIHHAGIPLALYVVLQDYRFLLLDVFLRALASGLLAGGFTLAFVWANSEWHLLQLAASSPMFAGIAMVVACCVLIAFSSLRGNVQDWVTRRVFRRNAVSDMVNRLLESSTACVEERELLENAARVLAESFGATRYCVLNGFTATRTSGPDLATDDQRAALGSWVEAIIPLQFARGDQYRILLGPRSGALRYLSEDLRELARLASVVVAQVERLRWEGAERLTAEAELRALQAQINPHFLFNALNALFGTIPRSAEAARRTVLNLAEIFRYFLHNQRSAIALEEELKIIHAYLEIEQIRLGDRLRTEVDVDENALTFRLPPLSIQPLVENAVKHGVARRSGPGYVILRIRRNESNLRVEVRDSGGALLPSDDAHGGVGLENVRQRLRLTYGAVAELQVAAENGETVVRFELPAGPVRDQEHRSPEIVTR